MRRGDIYTHREDPTFVVRVGDVNDGIVSFAGEGGGRVHGVPAEKFGADFEVETPDARARRLTYDKGAVTLESWGYDYQLPAWLNGSYWNGWLMPAFEKQDLLDAIAKNMLYGAFFHEEGDAFIVLGSAGEDMPPFDPAVLLPRILAEAGETDLLEVNVDGVPLEATIYRGRDILRTDGTQVRVYDLGSGYYTWESATPVADSAGSPAP